MATKQQAPQRGPLSPEWPTAIAGRLPDGRVIGTDRSVWVYRRVNLAPVEEARSAENAIAAGGPLHAAIEGLSELPAIRGDRRATSRSAYRKIHVLLVNVPKPYRAPKGDLNAYLDEDFHSTITFDRVLLLGVQLVPTVGTGGFKSAMDSIVESFVSKGIPMSDFDRDFEKVDRVLLNAGLQVPTSEQFRLADSWWNDGKYPDVYTLPHEDHIHYFQSVDSKRAVEAGDPRSCDSWVDTPGQFSVTYAALQEADLKYVDIRDSAARWVVPMIRQNALVVSLRAFLEPSKITRGELRRQRKQYTSDIEDAYKQGQMNRQEHEEKLRELTEIEGLYSGGDAPATLVDMTGIVGFEGRIPDVRSFVDGPIQLNAMANRQRQAWRETLIASNDFASPYRHDMPTTAISMSGMPSLSTVGDKDGALIGLTELDRQAAYLSPTAASTSDGLPICAIVASTGGGKSLFALRLADQFARLKQTGSNKHIPVVFFDPKRSSDHDAAVTLSGGQVASLDSLVSSDGIVDALRFSQTTGEEGRYESIQSAHATIMQVRPWGAELADRFEAELLGAIDYGVRAGATCTGQALLIAKEAGLASEAMLEPIFRTAQASPTFRAMFGVDPQGSSLSISEGITLIKVGNMQLELPSPGAKNPSLIQRISIAFIRSVVFGSMMALTGRDGVLFLDEAWVIIGAAPDELERVGRLARSQGVLPVLMTQRVTDIVKAGLAGYISRVLIGPIEDEEEAASACQLIKVEPTPERIARITGKATMDSFGEEDAAPNWNSQRALFARNPDGTRRNLRGSVWLFSDLAGRVIPVESVIPPRFLKLASTNPEDIRVRKAELASANA